jgi:hypothetical protein
MRRALICDDGRYRNATSKALHCYMGLDGIRPADLLERARSQLEPYETISTARSSVIGIEKKGQLFVVEFKAHEIVRAKTIVVATGVVDELPAISGLKELFGKSRSRLSVLRRLGAPQCAGGRVWEGRQGYHLCYATSAMDRRSCALHRRPSAFIRAEDTLAQTRR